MPPPQISFRLVPDVRPSSGRAVGMLEGDDDLCASVLTSLPEKAAKYQRFSMERWTGGFDAPTERFHKFDGTDYFVFKDVARKHRFYGFLYHPLPKTNARFLLCVLTTYAKKKEDRTDPAELKRVKAWMDAPGTQNAIKCIYQDVDDED